MVDAEITGIIIIEGCSFEPELVEEGARERAGEG